MKWSTDPRRRRSFRRIKRLLQHGQQIPATIVACDKRLEPLVQPAENFDTLRFYESKPEFLEWFEVILTPDGNMEMWGYDRKIRHRCKLH